MSVIYITFDHFSRIRFEKVKCKARANQLIALARRPNEALPIDDGDLLPALLNEPGLFELTSGVGDRWSLNAKHFREQFWEISNVSSSLRSRINEQPTR